MTRSRTAALTAAGLTTTLLSTTVLTLIPLGAPAHAQSEQPPSAYVLDGDEGGSKFEGIGVDEQRDTFYVSEVTGGEIHRGTAGSAGTEQWLDGDGTDGRFTARGITTDGAGRVFIAGGPNGIGNDRPDLWVYAPSGQLLAALRAPGEDVFLNDVWVGPDGAAYFTNSNAPQIFRVADQDGRFDVELWADATGTIPTAEGFNLGGIVTSPDGRALVVAQGNTGKLWRFDLRDASVSQVDLQGADLVNADGLARQGFSLTVVRNFSRVISTLRLDPDGTRAQLLSERATDPERVLTTAKPLLGRLLYVDSHFDEEVAVPPYEVVIDPFVGAAPVRPVARTTDRACPPQQVPAAGFVDVDPASVHAGAVSCLLWWGVTSGRTATSYAPAGTVTRAQMATFIAHTITQSGGSLPAADDRFADDDGNVHQPNIDRLAAAGIVTGRADGSYGPDAPVSRAAMATFLTRAIEHRTGQPLPAGTDAFADDDGNVHEQAIDQAAEAGLTGGTNGAYDPDGPVTREQMASFLTRTLDLLVAGGQATQVPRTTRPAPLPTPAAVVAPAP